MKSLNILILVLFFSAASAHAQERNIVFSDDFESGWGSWYADNGIWECGVPQTGPTAAYSGVNCIGTDLDDQYPYQAETRLISPSITLPSGHIRLKVREWHSMGNGDFGLIQISTDGVDWETVSLNNIYIHSPCWSQLCVDVSDYANNDIRLGFYFYANSDVSIGNGWYVDDVTIVESDEIFYNPEDFESGEGDWFADNGLWVVGEPTVGPGTTHSGSSCAGTVLDGSSPYYADTRFISPLITLGEIPGHQPELFFWQWFSFGNGDIGQVEISVNDGEWQTVSGFGGPYTGHNATWSQAFVPLSDYTGMTIRLGFHYTTNDDVSIGNGWYIDDIRIQGAALNIEDYEDNSMLEPFVLRQNHPNPFKKETSISFDILEDRLDIDLAVYNLAGKHIVTLADSKFHRGAYTLVWDGIDSNSSRVSPGIYMLVMTSGQQKQVRKMCIY